MSDTRAVLLVLRRGDVPIVDAVVEVRASEVARAHENERFPPGRIVDEERQRSCLGRIAIEQLRLQRCADVLL